MIQRNSQKVSAVVKESVRSWLLVVKIIQVLVTAAFSLFMQRAAFFLVPCAGRVCHGKLPALQTAGTKRNARALATSRVMGAACRIFPGACNLVNISW